MLDFVRRVTEGFLLFDWLRDSQGPCPASVSALGCETEEGSAKVSDVYVPSSQPAGQAATGGQKSDKAPFQSETSFRTLQESCRDRPDTVKKSDSPLTFRALNLAIVALG